MSGTSNGKQGAICLTFLAITIGGCSGASAPARASAKGAAPVRAPASTPATAPERPAALVREEKIYEDAVGVSADGRMILLNTSRGMALLDAATGETRLWLEADAKDDSVEGAFVQGRPDEVVFFHGAHDGQRNIGECLVVSIESGAVRARVPGCFIPYGMLRDGGPLAMPPFLVRTGATERGDDEIVSWTEAGLKAFPVAPGQEKTAARVWALSVRPDARSFVAIFLGDPEGTLRVWGESGRFLSSVPGRLPSVFNRLLPAFSPDGRWVALRFDSPRRGGVLVLDTATARSRHELKGPCSSPMSFAWSADSKLLAVGDEDRSCMFELGKGLLWSKKLVELEGCFRCQKVPDFALHDRVVVVPADVEKPGAAVLEARSGRVVVSSPYLGTVQESDGELRVVTSTEKGDATEVTVDSSLKIRSRALPQTEDDSVWTEPENPIVVKLRAQVCVRDGHVFPSRQCESRER